MVGKFANVLERGGQIVLFFFFFSTSLLASLFHFSVVIVVSYWGGKKLDIFSHTFYVLASNERRRFVFSFFFHFDLAYCIFWNTYIYHLVYFVWGASVDALSVLTVFPIYHTKLYQFRGEKSISVSPCCQLNRDGFYAIQ